MKTQDSSPIFVHSLFRTGSTYIFNVFRRSDSGYWCYQEPLNEYLLHASTDPGKLLEVDKDAKEHYRHPELNKPYFYEFHTIAMDVGRLFRKKFSYDQFFITDDDDATEIREYFNALVNGAQGRAVFQCCRTVGRVKRLKSECGGVHIFLWRNPWDQWWSYKKNICFDISNLLIANSPSAPSFIQQLRDGLDIDTFHSSDFWSEYEQIAKQRLNASASYMLFYALWCYAMLEAKPYCDKIINIDRLGTSESYRNEVTKGLANIGIKGLDFSDCAIPIGVYGNKDIDFFKDIEDQVHELLLSHGFSQIQLDEMMRLRTEFSMPPNEVNNTERTTGRDAERARELVRQFETELAEGYRATRDALSKARQAVLETQQANERHQQAVLETRQANERHQQALLETRQANEQHQQALLETQQAKTREKHLESVMQGIFNSRSWRITSPLRWFGHQKKLLSQHGLCARFAALKKKILPPKSTSPVATDGELTEAVKYQYLSPHARRIYTDIKSAIKNRDAGGS